MALKNIYKEVEDEKENQVKEDDMVKIPRDECIAEHKRLIKVLRSGNKKMQEEEAQNQEEELSEYEGDEDEDEDENDA